MLCLMVVGCLHSHLPGATLSVTNTLDSGPGSLRQAILDAASLNPAVISFGSVTGLVTLTTPLPALASDVSIFGPSTGNITISGNGQVRILTVNAGATVLLSNVIIANGRATNLSGGAGILNLGTLSITNCVVANNQTRGGSGGGICNSGILWVADSTIGTNQAIGGNGVAGLYGAGGGGGGAGLGGGVFSGAGSVTLLNTRVVANSAIGGTGGRSSGIGYGSVPSSPGGSPNGGDGGGIYESGFPLPPQPFALPGGNGGLGGGGGGGARSSNCGQGGMGGFGGGAGASCGGSGGGGAGLGGGLLVQSGTLEILGSTVSGNTASGGAAGIGRDLFRAGGQLVVSNSVVADQIGLPPSIVSFTPSQIAVPGTNLALGVTVSGPLPFVYQWQKNGVEIRDATNNTHLLASVRLDDAGVYSVVVSNFYGTITSTNIFIWVAPPRPVVEWTSPPDGMSGPIEIAGIACDSFGNAFVVGSFASYAIFGSYSFTNPSSLTNGYHQSFTVKLDVAGHYLWARSVTTEGSYAGNDSTGAALDTEGNLYVTGNFARTNHFGRITLSSGYGDLFVARCDAAGEFIWVRQFGLTNVFGSSIKTDRSGNSYVVAAFWGPGSSTQGILAGKLAPDGVVQWTRIVPVASNTGMAPRLAVDSAGNCYVAGTFWSGTLTFGSTILTNASTGYGDTYLTKFDPTGEVEWAVHAGGPLQAGVYDAAVDSLDNVYVAGSFRGTATFGDIVLSTAFADAFIAKYAPSGVPQGGWQLGATNACIQAIALDSYGNAYVGGTFQGYLNTTKGTLASGGWGDDFFVACLDPAGELVWLFQDGPNEPESRITLALAEPSYLYAGGIQCPLSWCRSSETNEAYLAKLRTGLVPLNVGTQGQGTIMRTPDKAVYNLGEQVTLLALPDRWYRFMSWSDGATNNPRMIDVTISNSFTAIFAPTTPLETLTFGTMSRTAPVGMPAIFVDGQFIPSGSATNLRSATITVQSTFTNGSIFYTRTGDPPSLLSQHYTNSFAVKASCTIRAIAFNSSFSQAWEADPVQVTIVPAFVLDTSGSGGGGTLSISPTNSPYLSNTVLTISAGPGPGWTFLQWLGDENCATQTISLIMGTDKRLRPVFGTTVNTTVAGNGTVLLDPVAGLYPYGYLVTATAVPQADNSFATWSNAGSGTNNPLRSVVTNANPTISATFGQLPAGQYSLTVIPTGNGRVDASPRANRYASGQAVTLTAAPNSGESFLNWSGDTNGNQNPLVLVMNQSKVVRATFTGSPRLSGFESAGSASRRTFEGALTGVLGARFQIDQSADLLSWYPLLTLTNIYGETQFAHSIGTNRNQRYYRARLLP